MSSTKEIRNRIKAIGSTAKITKAMEMVAASKMKKAQNEAVSGRAYSNGIFTILKNLEADSSIKHPLLQNNSEQDRKLLIVIASDKGLCGSFNTSVFKKALEYIRNNSEVDLVTIGKKTEKFFSNKFKIKASYTDFPISPSERDVAPIIFSADEDFTKGMYSEVAVCYTHFHSTLKQEAAVKTLLPLTYNGDGEAENLTFKFEPCRNDVIKELIPRILEVQLFQMVLESIASEQSARMIAMKNATDSAKELIEDLNLTYNSIRQASITQELAEISAAANSLAK